MTDREISRSVRRTDHEIREISRCVTDREISRSVTDREISRSVRRTDREITRV